MANFAALIEARTALTAVVTQRTRPRTRETVKRMRCVDGSRNATSASADHAGDDEVPHAGRDNVDHGKNDADNDAYEGDNRQHESDAGERDVGEGPNDAHSEAGGESVQPGNSPSEAKRTNDDAVYIADKPDEKAEDEPAVGLDRRADGDDRRGADGNDQRDQHAEDIERRAYK